MSIRVNPTAFLNPNAIKMAMTANDLDLPQPKETQNHQPIAMAAGESYDIYSTGHLRVGRYVVRSWSVDDRFGAFVTMDNVLSNSSIHLTISQLLYLETHRRMRPNNTGQRNDNAPGTAFKLSDKRKEKATRYLGYVEACLKGANDAQQPVRRGIIEAAVRNHAAITGDNDPPCYNTMALKIKQYSNGSFDYLVALAPKTGSGNRSHRFCDRIEELLADAVECAWRLKSGDWLDVKRLFVSQLKKPENADLKAITHESGCFVRPSNRTMQRRFGAIDDYQRTLWRYGAAYAKKHCDIYIRQALPDHPLDIVDVDFTPIHVTVIDDERPIIYGRPHLIAFRDRKTGSILSKAVSFVGASFEAFLEALKMAITPKDMSAYPGLEWKQHGAFVRLGVDNDQALINDDVRFTLSQLGIQLVEYRPGHPWEKGGVERLFSILNQDVVHNLPGATMSNVVERQKFADVNEEEPQITLSELDSFLTHYICEDYHRSAHKGLGMLRTLDGVPNKLWDEGIKNAKNRRPFDHDILVRASGNTSEVAIRNGNVIWDNLVYTHPDLLVVQADAGNKTAVPGVSTTLYKAWRDPTDLGEIYILDHHHDRVITVPVQPIDAWYAKGLRLYQHRKIIAYNREMGRDSRDFEGALDSFADRLVEINRIRGNRHTRQALARFHAKASKKYVRSRIVEIDHEAPSGAVPMELGNTSPAQSASSVFVAPQPSAPTPNEQAVPQFTQPKPPSSPAAYSPSVGKKYDLDVDSDDDDISALFNKKDDDK
ncbi:DDE-type integrase/transposase/recombinase [Rhizobium sp. B230/85]|uniref:DDE-type integrase/transposase/recombinase n=1 Tax=unclassified Rhizobium TaxID=2613769 RepID=UPI001ADAB1F8|nr:MULTISPECIES: DDE-type integrase/transposase/recombinase [unclassified Rhizobium]MBO9133571.1 DDE-type integrase/transposase/recombinase [Rhizobium sp. B209b/85]QXZ97266.1 DDE-type integrase/transposase/recombinase [Rhizobium sp. B230/85]